MVILSVEDLLIVSSNLRGDDHVKNKLTSCFNMKDLGCVKQFHAIEISRYRPITSLHFTQKAYIEKILNRMNICSAQPFDTPISNPDFSRNEDPNLFLSSVVPFRSAIRNPMYPMICSRPDLAFFVGNLPNFCEYLLDSHWKDVKRVNRYLTGTNHFKLRYKQADNPNVIGFSDSAWGTWKITRHFFLRSLRSKCEVVQSLRDPRNNPSILSHPAKLNTSLPAVPERGAIWLLSILKDMLDTSCTTLINILTDNTVSIGLAQNELINKRNIII